MPLEQLVLANHCYHREVQYRHRSCAGIRLLCGPCHLAIGTYDYYAAFLQQMAERRPDQYPWQDCLIGLAEYLEKLLLLTSKGVNPADRNELEIAKW